MKNYIDIILNELNRYSPEKALKIELLSGGASGKLIHRIYTKSKTVIGIYNADIPENRAFIGFSDVFRTLSLNVPEIFHVSDNLEIYFISDFGDLTLHRYLMDAADSEDRMNMNKSAINNLIKFQVLGKDKIDFNLCYQTSAFNLNQILLDEKKFIEHYLPHNKKKTDLKVIEHSFQIINQKVLSEKEYYFMYRDFQPRNIMVHDGNLYFLDYQSGRKGPLLYDLASYLYSGSITLTENEREELKSYYLESLSEFNVTIDNFEDKWDYIVLIRMIQMLGSYSFSYDERKDNYYKQKIVSGIEKIKPLAEKISNNEIKVFIESLEYYS